MSYHLLNVETGEYLYIDEHVWIKALETAKENYWQPGGTSFDLAYSIYDECEFLEDPMEIMFMIIVINNEIMEWDGNYTEKKNQVIDYEDTLYLADSLNGTDTPAELVEFIQKGSFRICAP